ncbi:hypothetical protein CEE45_08650 [Candidatus Heimdallarchaeota archaeon B3_Heim]|nr:MAG: hypothetical protein CEE45_08650 [Candidatus Heimdallarchaeota archaeon B3_Heim]
MFNMNNKLEGNDEIPHKEEYRGFSSKHMVLAVVFISIFSFALIIGLQEIPEQEVIAAKQDGENLIIQLDDVTAKAKFYFYQIADVKIKFFAVLGFDNQPHIAFDACDVCYEAKQGYAQEDPYMRCLNCGNTFLVSGIGTENLSGGCWPSHLPVMITDGKIIIKISDVIQKQFMFD